MYIPQHFRISDLPALHDVIDRHAFAVIVTTGGGGAPFATHLPFYLQRGEGPNGTLYAHMARANPHWGAFDGAREALVIFQGEHGYVTPAWYEGAENVPTWNYLAVHAYGAPRVIEEPAQERRVLETLVEMNESPREEPWSTARLSEGYMERMRKGIVAFSMPIERIEGKFKISQNRPPADRDRVIANFSRSDRAGDRALAAVMSEYYTGH
ncbi:MAG: FMN-binding negative transcriptional regulator [bacterium]|nr:FMN-binding negative transcriptional regulator [bacterium]